MESNELSVALAKICAVLTHPSISILGLVIGIWGLVVTLRSRRRVKGHYLTQYIAWLTASTKHDGLEMRYRGEPVEQIGATEAVFWNAGNQTIRHEDFSKDFPLQLVVMGANRIFSVEIVGKVPDSLNLQLRPTERREPDEALSVWRFSVDFEFIEPNEGLRVKVIHDGGFNTKANFVGRLAGSGELIQRSASLFGPVSSTKEKFFLSQAFLALGLIGIYCVYRIFTGEWSWLHGIGSICVIYLFAIPSVAFAEVVPKGLGRK